jgi:undecaprenyl-phosphate 4-deoxy-4-formamido-L-arabinose transferase
MIESQLKSGISVVIPVYNSAQILPTLVERLASVLPGLSGEFEVILVNDGSHDESWKVIQSLSAKHQWIRGVCLMRNFGQHNALLAGVRCAIHDIIVTLDDDLQNPPEEILALTSRLSDNVDLVYGIPMERQHQNWRNVCSAGVRLSLTPLIGQYNASVVSSFRAFRTNLRQAFEKYNDPFVSIDVLLTWGAHGVDSVKVKHDARARGTSSYTIFKLVSHAIAMLTGYSAFPLRLASFTGFAFVLFGIFILFYVIGLYFINKGSVPGFPFLASIIALFSGAQLFAIGIIGEYLAKIHFRSMNRPAYIVAQRI